MNWPEFWRGFRHGAGEHAIDVAAIASISSLALVGSLWAALLASAIAASWNVLTYWQGIKRGRGEASNG